MNIAENLKALLEIQGLDLSETLNHNDISFILVQCLDEIEKLREALKKIAYRPHTTLPNNSFINELRGIAHDALQQKDSE